jgi:hypothetical protein
MLGGAAFPTRLLDGCGAYLPSMLTLGAASVNERPVGVMAQVQRMSG